MPHYADLSKCDYFGAGANDLLAVGWLASGQPYPRGEVSREFFGALVRLLIDPWEPKIQDGWETCPFCRFTGGPFPFEITYEGTLVRLGISNLFVPSATRSFVTPSLIAHYIDSHDYCPPEEFQRAVIACPPMRSAEYMNLLPLSLRARGTAGAVDAARGTDRA